MLVAGLGLLVVLGTALVIGVVIKRMYAGPAAASTVADTPVPGAVAALLPGGSHIAGLAGAGGAFAVWVSGADGDKVFLIDPRTGRLSLALSAAK
jgi:hypothetical protein